MAHFVTITEFAERTTHWLAVSASQPLIVTKNGKPTHTVTGYEAPSAEPEFLGVTEIRSCEVKTRDLSRRTHSVMDTLEIDGVVGIVTNRGRARAVIDPVDQAQLDEYAAAVLAGSPAYAASRAKADAEFAAGKTRTLDEFFDELD